MHGKICSLYQSSSVSLHAALYSVQDTRVAWQWIAPAVKDKLKSLLLPHRADALNLSSGFILCTHQRLPRLFCEVSSGYLVLNCSDSPACWGLPQNIITRGMQWETSWLGLAWLRSASLVLQKDASGPWFGALPMETQLLPDLQVSGAVASLAPTIESGVGRTTSSTRNVKLNIGCLVTYTSINFAVLWSLRAELFLLWKGEEQRKSARPVAELTPIP